MKIEGFVTSSQWGDKFVKRRKMSLPRPTMKGQLTKEWGLQMVKLRTNIIKLPEDLPESQIGNFEEVSIKCDISLGYTVDNKDAKEILIKITGPKRKVSQSISVFSKTQQISHYALF